MLAVFRVMVERTLWLRGALPDAGVAGGIPPAAIARESAEHAREAIVMEPDAEPDPSEPERLGTRTGLISSDGTHQTKIHGVSEICPRLLESVTTRTGSRPERVTTRTRLIPRSRPERVTTRTGHDPNEVDSPASAHALVSRPAL